MDTSNQNPASDGVSEHRAAKASRRTIAAKWNTRILTGLNTAWRKNPEVNLISLFPASYNNQLDAFQRIASLPKPNTQALVLEDVRSRLQATSKPVVTSELSEEVRSLHSNNAEGSEDIIAQLKNGEVLYRTQSRMVVRIGHGIAAKISDKQQSKNEHSCLQYLQTHLPSFPAPRTHGLIEIGFYSITYMTYIPGFDLERAWSEMDVTQKEDISSQLDTLLSSLRSLPFASNTPLGGVHGGGCVDARRGRRISPTPIMSTKEFEDFMFSGSKTASPSYIGFLRKLAPEPSDKCVFTHGDVRPANIMVDKDVVGQWKIQAVIDWERSGFYPEYWECVKATNNLAPSVDYDWYEYLPRCMSPAQFPLLWLLDRVWQPSLAHN